VTCLAFMLVGDDGLWNVEEGGTHRDDGAEIDSFSSILIYGSSSHTAESHRPFLVSPVYSILCLAAYP
jgi:hypothetical protein